MFSVPYLNELRTVELAQIAARFPAGTRTVLEIGAGTGRQALELERRGLEVLAVDLPASGYASDRVFPVRDYDGRTLPFADRSFDIVFSSNVLEHVRDLPALHAEIRRVLRPGGIGIHVMPTHAWRFWTMLTSFPNAAGWVVQAIRGRAPWRTAIRQCGAAVLQPRHGERGVGVAELWLFRPQWWRDHFAAHGFAVVHDEPMDLFYTGNMLLGPRLSFTSRRRLARWAGAASHLFEVRPKS
jgi:SAM-dependent methyltransferase